MSTRGKDIAVATLFLLSCGWLTGGCTRSEPVEEKKPAPAAVQATTVPSPAAAQEGAADDQYDDSLVLLADGAPDAGFAPLVVQFEVESLVVDEIPGAKYTWNFGDGSPKSNEASPKHTYQKPGEYTATIGVIDANGERGWDEVDISVDEPDAGD